MRVIKQLVTHFLQCSVPSNWVRLCTERSGFLKIKDSHGLCLPPLVFLDLAAAPTPLPLLGFPRITLGKNLQIPETGSKLGEGTGGGPLGKLTQ